MKPSRLTLLGLMGVIAVVALFLAAFRHPTPLVASIAWTGVLTILIVAALVAVLDPRRTFWVGFAVVGLIFAGFASWPVDSSEVELPLLTSHVLAYFFWNMTGWLRHRSLLGVVTANNPGSGLMLSDVLFISFLRTGQAFAALIHATAGGILAIVLKARLHRKDQQKSDL